MAVLSRVSVSVPIAMYVAMLFDISSKSHFNVTPYPLHVDHGSTTIAVELCKVKAGDDIFQVEQVSIVPDDINVLT